MTRELMFLSEGRILLKDSLGNVRELPRAAEDGTTDDTAAVQRALDEATEES